jgi:hypothetical protein
MEVAACHCKGRMGNRAAGKKKKKKIQNRSGVISTKAFERAVRKVTDFFRKKKKKNGLPRV